ncbi:MAG TPA: ABC transporter ATP-binding protein [Beijerinckiaceae bacterium]|nr:ABC transporter ATP-binding protein [Beijerinckiaceae bacterium]
MTILRVDGVSKSFRGLLALDKVSFEVERGEIFAVVGPNGAGKTTLFNVLAGVYRPQSGSVWFEDERIDGLRPDSICVRGVARTFQIVRPFAGLSVFDNVVIGALLRADLAGARATSEQILRSLELWDKRARPAGALTLPDRKRLELARALATGPKLLLLDEVMAGLRPAEIDRAVAMLREINQGGVTIVMIEHVMRAVTALADRIHVLHHGASLAQGTPQEVTSDPRVIESYLGAESFE